MFAGRLTEYLSDLKYPWAEICKQAKLEDVRIHDLRHTYASHFVSRGASLPMVGKLLGHTQAQTTARYAHLAPIPLRSLVICVTQKKTALARFHKIISEKDVSGGVRQGMAWAWIFNVPT